MLGPCWCERESGAPGRRKARERPSLGDVGVEDGRERPVGGRLGSARLRATRRGWLVGLRVT
ncbi:hypothetical protein PUN28_009734 [Cardiocondyla obscurior]|uniref:Histone H3 n=1 Tax=Cardiocondyla obscurior TaxID=286306 RepID=A0AAW2FR24_9HYME